MDAGVLTSAGGPSLSAGPSVDEDPCGAWITLNSGIQALLDDPASSAKEISHARAGTHRLDDATAMFFLGDIVVHTWDLARASGLDEPLDEMLRASGQYRPKVEVPPDADSRRG